MSSGAPGIDKIFKMICEEALKRPGIDLVKNLNTVSVEVMGKVLKFIAYVREKEREELNRKDGHR
ncbi:hypothetical protein ES703_65596 [subsurface metagenome]